MRISLLATAVLLVFALAACGDDGAAQGTSSPAAGAASDEAPPNAEAPAGSGTVSGSSTVVVPETTSVTENPDRGSDDNVDPEDEGEAEEEPETANDRPPAPDFTLALGDGGEFTLGDETRPVFLVFWAEW